SSTRSSSISSPCSRTYSCAALRMASADLSVGSIVPSATRAFATYVRIFMAKDGGNSRSSRSSMLCTFADVSSERHPAPHDHVRVRGRLPGAHNEPCLVHALLALLVGHALGAGNPCREHLPRR